MKYLPNYVTVISLLSFCCVFSQTRQIDSLRKAAGRESSLSDKSVTLSNLAFHYVDVNRDSAKSIGSRALQMAERSRSKAAFASAWNTNGWIKFRDGSYDEALTLIGKAAAAYRQLKDPSQLQRCLYNLSQVYLQLAKTDKALECLTEALNSLERHPDRTILPSVLKAIGSVYRAAGQYRESETYLKKAVAVAPDTKMKADIMINIGNLYQAEKKYAAALDIYYKALSITTSDDDNQIAMIEENLGRVYTEQYDFGRARLHYTNALNVWKRLGNKADILYEYFNLAQIAGAEGKFGEAVSLYQRAYDMAKETGNDNYRLRCVYMLALLNENSNEGTWENVVYYYKWYYELRDSLNIKEQKLRLDELRTKFESDQKDKAIKLLNKDKLVQEKETKLNRTLAIILALIIAVILISIAFVINRNKLKERNRELELRNRIASDLHDDVGSSLSSIRLLGELVRDKHAASPALLEKMSENIRETLESMGDIVWMIKPEAETNSAGLARRMEKFLSEICASSGKECRFTEENTDNLSLSMLQKRNLYLIFKEAVNNAVKYAEATSITASLRHSDKMLRMEISDDGIGFARNDIDVGNGLDNMEQRARDIDATLTIESGLGKGTTVVVETKV